MNRANAGLTVLAGRTPRAIRDTALCERRQILVLGLVNRPALPGKGTGIQQSPAFTRCPRRAMVVMIAADMQAGMTGR